MNTTSEKEVSNEPPSERLEHTLHYAHMAHVAAEMGEKALKQMEPAAKFFQEITVAQRLLKTHGQMARDLARMQHYRWKLSDAQKLGGSVKELLAPRLQRAGLAYWRMKNAFQAEHEAAGAASRLLRETSALRYSARGAAILRVGQSVEKFLVALRGSMVGSKLLATGRIVTSRPVTNGLIVIGAAVGAYQGYRQTSARTTGGRIANGVLGGGAGYLTAANLWVGAADLVLPKGYQPGEIFRGTADSLSVIGESVAAGDSGGLEDVHQKSMNGDYGAVLQYFAGLGSFVSDVTPAIRQQIIGEDSKPLDEVHKRSMSGAYGKVLQAASEAGEFWADQGLGGGMGEFVNSLKWWVSH